MTDCTAASDLAPPPARLPPGYYLDDFFAVIAGVESRYAGILSSVEHAYLHKIKTLSRPAQLLYARLVNRKGPFFRLDRLAYAEIGPLGAPLAELLAAQLLEPCRPPCEPARRRRLLHCFTHDELRAALHSHPAPRRVTKAALLAWLDGWQDRDPWLQTLLAGTPVMARGDADPWPYLRFLFFGEIRDNLADFVTHALGHVATEPVDPAQLSPYFTSRAQAEDGYRMARTYQSFREIRSETSAAQLLRWWQQQAVQRAGLAGGHAWFDRLVDRLGRRLEREQQSAAALELYATSPHAPARERRARLLLKAGRVTEAAALLEAMLAAPCHSAEAYAARQLRARLDKTFRRSEARHYQIESRTLHLPYLPRGGRGAAGPQGAPAVTVETAVLAHYRSLGWQGVHAENWLWNASFGLLLWDIIYDPSHQSFHAPHQSAPADLYEPAFYARRQAAIETRLQSLHHPATAIAIMTRHFLQKSGLTNPFVYWHDALPEVLAIMLQRLPAAGHAAVLRHMARDFRHHACGFMDLFIWNEHDYRFIEIKGENDQLAAHQYEWLRLFADFGLNVAVEQVVRPAPA